MTQNTLTPFQEAMSYYGIDLSRVRLYVGAQTPLSSQKCALVYVGPDESGRQAVADFATWLFHWLDERRKDIARLLRANDVAGAGEQVHLFAGPTEVLRVLGKWGALDWTIALHMVGRLTANSDPDQYASAYFKGGADMLQAVLSITAKRPSWEPNTGGQQQPVADNLLIKGLTGDQFRSLLQSLTPNEQMQMLEQVVFDSVETFGFPFEPLTR